VKTDPTVTVCVLVRDEAQNLADLLPTLDWADELLVVIDDATTDDSELIAEAFADRIERRPFTSFSAFRNVAMDLARGTWIFFVDADERVSPALANEIQGAVAAASDETQGETTPVAYAVPRLNVMFGRLIRGGGWYPDEQLRLLRRDLARYDESELVHERASVAGPSGRLTQPLLHLNYQSFRQFIAKQRRYTALEAATWARRGERPRTRSLIGAPVREFIRRYFTLRGWADGPIGLFLSIAMAYYAYKRINLIRDQLEPGRAPAR
jgi:glycosyltransferase involved in cell wall biosynthesis